jgi:hypothetical protein
MFNIIHKNFILSVFITFFGCLILFALYSSGFPESLSSVFPYRNHALMWPLIISALTLIFWFFCYKNGHGYFVAFLMGFCILMPVFNSIISTAINDVTFNKFILVFLAYSGISHILYGLTDWRNVFKGLNQDAS